MAQTEKSAPDWERIEADYRAGVLSVREIAIVQGISHTAINKRAKAEGWERDLAAKIKSKADALVSKREVSTQVSTETAVSERLIVEANAEVIAQVRLNHRGDIARARKLCMSLLAEIEVETDNLSLFEELGELLRADDDKGQDKRNDIYRRVISGASRIDSMKKLADALKVLVGLEREAYSIDADQKGAGGGDEMAAVLRDLIEKLPG